MARSLAWSGRCPNHRQDGRLKHFQKISRRRNIGKANNATASWTAAALCRFGVVNLRWKSGKGLPQSKTLRTFDPIYDFETIPFSTDANSPLSVS